LPQAPENQERPREGEFPAADPLDERAGVEAFEAGDFAVPIARHEARIEIGFEAHQVLHHVALGQRPDDAQGRPVDAAHGHAGVDSRLFGCFPAHRLVERLHPPVAGSGIEAHQAAGQAVEPARIDGLVGRPALHPQAGAGDPAEQVHCDGAQAEDPHRRPFDAPEHGAVGGEHRQRFAAPGPEPAGIAQRMRDRRQPGIDRAGRNGIRGPVGTGSKGEDVVVEREARYRTRQQAGIVGLHRAHRPAVDREADARARRRDGGRRQGAFMQGRDARRVPGGVVQTRPPGAGGWARR